MYGFTKSNMEYIFRELDEDNDGWPEGLGNVERSGMGEEKLDNTVYTIRGLYDLADMARSKGDVKTAAWALKRARTMESRFEAAWWFGQEGATQYADSIDPSPVGGDNTKIFQRHWIGATPMESRARQRHRQRQRFCGGLGQRHRRRIQHYCDPGRRIAGTPRRAHSAGEQGDSLRYPRRRTR